MFHAQVSCGMQKQAFQSLSLLNQKKSWLAAAKPSVGRFKDLNIIYFIVDYVGMTPTINCTLQSSQIIFYSQCHAKEGFAELALVKRFF